jgi:uncharacterized protein (DUF1501 family)
MSISRRRFIQGLGAVSFFLSAPHTLALAAQAAEFRPRGAGSKVLVLVQMGGGNDGLNTVVPYSMGQYYSFRPVISIAQDKILKLDDHVGFNPNMDALHGLFTQGKVAVVQAVGYPTPNRSHFRSIEIWQTGNPEKIIETGWLGRYLDYGDFNDNLFAAVNVEPALPKSLASNKCMVPSVSNVFDFKFRTDPKFVADHDTQLQAFNSIYENFELKRPEVDLLRKAGIDANKASDYLQKIVRGYKSDVKYPNGSFGNGLKFIAQMLAGGVDAKIFTVNIDGFDTHSNQLGVQNRLLKNFSDGISAFYRDLTNHYLQDDVLIVAFSEFGRRVAENNGRGTDHGTAAPVYVIGSQVKGGVYGDHPSLTNLDEGDLKFATDFRSIYATVLDKWLNADSRQILGRDFDKLPIV